MSDDRPDWYHDGFTSARQAEDAHQREAENEAAAAADRQALSTAVTFEAHAYARYWWDCGSCAQTNDEADLDPAGETRKCEHCGAVNDLGETR